MTTVMQEVNLYQPAAKGVRGALSAGSTRNILLLVATTLLGMWAFAWWQVGRLNDATLVVRNQQQAQAAMSAAQGPQLDALGDDELTALNSRLTASIDAKSYALALIAGDSQQPVVGFSARLRAFGERHIEGVWLDHLTLGSTVDSVSISGSAVSPDSVPRYLRSLAQDPALKGGQIDEFIIEQPHSKTQGGRLSFRAGQRGLAPLEPKTADEESS